MCFLVKSFHTPCGHWNISQIRTHCKEILKEFPLVDPKTKQTRAHYPPKTDMGCKNRVFSEENVDELCDRCSGRELCQEKHRNELGYSPSITLRVYNEQGEDVICDFRNISRGTDFSNPAEWEALRGELLEGADQSSLNEPAIGSIQQNIADVVALRILWNEQAE